MHSIYDLSLFEQGRCGRIQVLWFFIPHSPSTKAYNPSPGVRYGEHDPVFEPVIIVVPMPVYETGLFSQFQGYALFNKEV